MDVEVVLDIVAEVENFWSRATVYVVEVTVRVGK